MMSAIESGGMASLFRRGISLVVAAVALGIAGPARAATVSEVSQYGITWTFDRPCVAGQFVTGDWWVVGPVKIIRVSPAAGGADAAEVTVNAASRYGAKAFQADRRMRNGSMVQPVPGETQGYDSRLLNYKPDLSATFPLDLTPGQSLVSTVSSQSIKPAKDGSPQLATPFVIGQQKFMLCPPELPLAIESAAVLTCLAAEPPADAFRPAYSGSTHTIYREKDLKWDLLPKLRPVASVPSWPGMERVFQRPWLDHDTTWLIQYAGPGQNQPNYGREFARMTSIGALMLMLDVPQAQKRKLMIGYVQLGIDLHGVASTGRQWFSDGGHWQGRKWPILFASIMLGDEKLLAFPQVSPAMTLGGRIKLDPAGVGKTTTLFQEDLDTYYGQGGDGQKVLWQPVFHTGPKPPYQEKPRQSLDKDDKFVDAYQTNNAGSWIGTALAARLMKAVPIWNHNAYFDYMDAYMRPDFPNEFPKWLPKGATRGVDPFMEEMWHAYRSTAPDQAAGADDLKWVYTDAKVTNGRFGATQGMWLPNPSTIAKGAKQK